MTGGIRNVGSRILLLAALVFVAVGALPPADAGPSLQEARRALTGEHKDVEKARKLLLNIAQNRPAEADPETLALADIYLGYIQDRANNRQSAIGWYEKALAVKAAPPRILDLARFGLRQPLVWIRHLDSAEAQAEAESVQSAHKVAPQPLPKRAYVTKRPPAGLMPKWTLSPAERRENFEALWSIIDAYYGDFRLKSIDWVAVGRRYQAQLDKLTGNDDDDFYRLMFRLVNELKDSHSWLMNYSSTILELGDVPELPIDLFRGKAFIIAGDKAGWEVLSVDGMTLAEKMESLRPYLQACSSERAFRRRASRSLLAGKVGDTATVTLRSPEGQTETASFKRVPHAHHPPVGKVPITFRRFPSGLGYIRIESFMDKEELDHEFDQALEALRDTPGLILDIRDNEGGLGHGKIVGRFLRKRTLVAIDYTKKGPKQDDLMKHKYYFGPSGAWQYTRPVALLVNDLTGSAADLFTAELRRAGTVITVGTTTHGNLGSAIFAVLPCGLMVRISTGYISDAEDRPIEVNGNVPDLVVEPDIRDYLEGRDPVLERAKEVLLSKQDKH